MMAPDRFALTLGVVSMVSSVFVFTVAGPWALLTMPGGAIPVAVVLGLLACAAGVRRSPGFQLAIGIAFLAAALLVLGELAFGRKLTGGDSSTFAFWLSLGLGLAAAGRTPRETGEG
jgi:hypothetical protein